MCVQSAALNSCKALRTLLACLLLVSYWTLALLLSSTVGFAFQGTRYTGERRPRRFGVSWRREGKSRRPAWFLPFIIN